ncbi:hypothetical protein [Vibrio salinus]|uniref:hypothetical protein n=1 Tax=Vibrio salinus TaxID=2899784 RepID=UPI001E29110E|nr:hypothetical protein [Vibrio salinus]MCE0495743.1 hypothetical protein [Vibrio salinus]
MSEQEKGNLSIEETNTNFPKLMQDLDAGVIANVVGLALTNVARAVSHNDKPGEVKLNMKLKPMGTNNEMAEIACSISVKEPKANGNKSEDFKYTSLAFIGKNGKLTYDRPMEDIKGQLNLNDRKLQEVR